MSIVEEGILPGEVPRPRARDDDSLSEEVRPVVQTTHAISAIRHIQRKAIRAAPAGTKVKPPPAIAMPKPMPAGIDMSIPGIGDAWVWFQKIDDDDSGRLEWDEVVRLFKALGLKWSTRRLRRAYDDMAPLNQRGASFHDFAQWWARQQAIARRDMRRTVKELFEGADDDNSGILDKEEFGGLVMRANKDRALPVVGMARLGDAAAASDESRAPDFDLEQAWAEIRKVPYSEGKQLGVNFAGFEAWWKQKAGIFDPDLPVLPEFMVHKIGDKVKAQKFWNDAVATQDGRKRQADDVSSQSTQWQTLSAKLRALVSMERHWGALHDIYETRTESLFDEIPLGICVRDPDSQFSTVWDLSAVTMLVYVTITVPLRACFDIDMCLWSAGFWIDAIVDLFFIVDVFVNLRTSFYDRNGFRENRPSKMARNYMKGWFTIDVISCLPVGYVQYFVQTECSSGTSDNYKVVKTLRLLKMSKMLRLARVKRILARYGSDVNYQQYFNIGMTLFTILLLTHLLACVFYLIGEGSETLNNGQYVAGWVEQEENWWEAGSQNMSLAIALSAKYSTSMYYVLNALDDNGFTTTERSFGVMAEFCRDLILGLVASLITTIQMSMNSNDDEKSQKLKRLRTWMQTKRLPKAFQSRAMEHFNELWNNQSSIDLTEILDQCPPAMASNMSELLYGRFLSTVPIFHGLSPQVIGALCMRCKSLLAMKNQHIIREGEPGKEMYMVMGGEVEVSEARDGADQRLGFLSEGAFFGEAPVLGFDEVGLELRTRSVRAVTDTELCYLTRDDVQSLCADYPELNARIRRFGTAGLVVNDKRMRKVGITRKELETFSSEFKEQVRATSEVRKRHNLQRDAFVPSGMYPTTMTVIKAAVKFTKAGAHQRARERAAREARRAQITEDVMRQVEQGNELTAVLTATSQTREEVRSCVSMIEKMAEQMASLQKSVVVLEQASGS